MPVLSKVKKGYVNSTQVWFVPQIIPLVITNIFWQQIAEVKNECLNSIPQRGLITKPRVAVLRYPGVEVAPNSNLPQRGCVILGMNVVWENRRNSVGVEKREGEILLTQGSGVPQPWAMIWNPVGILNTCVGISIPYPERKDVIIDKDNTQGTSTATKQT